LLNYPQWQPYVVFPGEYVEPSRVVLSVDAPEATDSGSPRRPLFILLDATWAEARKMFRKSPYLDHLPVLSLQPDQISQYKLRRSRRNDHFCTSEVAAMCMSLAGEQAVEEALDAYLDVFTHHYLQAKNQSPVAWDSEAHRRLADVGQLCAGFATRTAAPLRPAQPTTPSPASNSISEAGSGTTDTK